MSIIINGKKFATSDTNDYEQLKDKPSVNGTTLVGTVTIDATSIEQVAILPVGANINRSKLYMQGGELKWYNGTAWVSLSVKSGATLTAGSGIEIDADGRVNHLNFVPTGTVGGTTVIPKITFDTEGHITGVEEVIVYPPTTLGNKGQYWRSKGEGAGVWQSTGIVAEGNNFLITGGDAYDFISQQSASGGISATDLLNLVYPVGAIYMSTINISPTSFLGGNWTPILDRTLVGAGDSNIVKATNGASSVEYTPKGTFKNGAVAINSVTLTTAHMPLVTVEQTDNHWHGATFGNNWKSGSTPNRMSWRDSWKNTDFTTSYGGEHSHTVGNASPTAVSFPTTTTQPTFTGTKTTINTLMPHYVVYMWQRSS